MISFCCENMKEAIVSGALKIHRDPISREIYVAPNYSSAPMLFCPYCMKELQVVVGYSYVKNK